MIHTLRIDHNHGMLALAVERLIQNSRLSDVVIVSMEERMMLPGSVLVIERSQPADRWSVECEVLWEFLRSVLGYSDYVAVPIPMERLRNVVANNPRLGEEIGNVFTYALGGDRVRH